MRSKNKITHKMMAVLVAALIVAMLLTSCGGGGGGGGGSTGGGSSTVEPTPTPTPRLHRVPTRHQPQLLRRSLIQSQAAR